MILSALLWLAIIGGALAAAAALYGRYKVLPAFLTGPATCQLEDGGCGVLFRTKRASLLGVPNSLLGVILYLLLAIGTVCGWPAWFLLLATTPALLMSIFLGYSLITNHLQCRICWFGHICNATLWIALLIRLINPQAFL
jgi:uncharacterized membrane protein